MAPSSATPAFVAVGELPSAQLQASTWTRLLINSQDVPAWTGESIIIWHRAGECWAVQEACPHAGISLAQSDIEDFRLDVNGEAAPGLGGPCIACPAHMYVFDIGTGACLSNSRTHHARTYAVRLDRVADGGATISVCPEATPAKAQPPQASEAAPGVPRTVANKIQLELVQIGLERKFGPASSDGAGGTAPDHSA